MVESGQAWCGGAWIGVARLCEVWRGVAWYSLFVWVFVMLNG